MSRWVVWLPLAIFAVLVGFFFKGLTLDPSAQPSALIGKPVPSFQLTDLHTGQVLTSRIPASQTVFTQCLGELVYYLSGRASVSHGAIQETTYRWFEL